MSAVNKPPVLGSIQVISGSQAGSTFKLSKSVTTIGRDPAQCDIVLTDPSVSRYHARIVKNGADWGIENLTQGNTVSVNSRNIRQETIHDHDTIGLGAAVTFLFLTSPASQNLGLPRTGDLPYPAPSSFFTGNLPYSAPSLIPTQERPEHKGFSRRQRLIAFVIIVLVVALAIVIAQILSGTMIIPAIWGNIASAIVGVFGSVFALFALIPLIFSSDQPKLATDLTPAQMAAPSHPSTSTQPIILQLPSIQQASHPAPQALLPASSFLKSISGSFPPTDPKTVQQRQKAVEEVYDKLIKPDINCIALTGIGGVGKSTLAALIYRYAEEHRKQGRGPFSAEAIWLAIGQSFTITDLTQSLFELLGKPAPDLTAIDIDKQAGMFFDVLNTMDKARLVILDQFENLLDPQTGYALTDRPGVGELVDALNNRKFEQSACRVLLTSRPRPVGTRRYLTTYMQIHPVEGLEISEGVKLLRSQGVKGKELELETAVERCEGHAYALVLLVALVSEDRVSLTSLLKDPALWTGGAGEVAITLLDAIYKQLNEVQRELLRAFSVYRMPISLEAARAVVTETLESDILPAFKVLRTQYLIQAPEEDCYQLHAIVSDYIQDHFDDRSGQANKQALRAAHGKAAQYYLQQTITRSPAHEKRRSAEDVQPLLEAIWHYCQAGQWQEAYDLILQEDLFSDLSRWGNNAVLYELIQLFLPSREWQPGHLERAYIYSNLGQVCNNLGKYEQSWEYYQRALDMQREIKDHRGEGYTLHHMGMLKLRRGDREAGFAFLRLALYIFETIQASSDSEKEKQWLDALREAIGNKAYEELVAKCEPHTYEIVEQALREGL